MNIKHLYIALLLFSFQIASTSEIPVQTEKDAYYDRWQETSYRDIEADLNNFKGEIPEEIKKIIECMQKRTGNCSPAYIFYGPPGNGKTMLGQVVAKEVEGVYLSMSSSDFEGPYTGTGPKRMEHFFQRAVQISKHVPVVMSIENIDSLVVNPISNLDDCTMQYAQTYHKLLNCIDSLPANNQIILIATTNRITSIDGKLKKPGRAETIEIKSPNQESRKAILKHYVSQYPNTIQEKLFDTISKNSEGFCSASFESMAKFASVNGSINEKSLNEAFNKVAKIEKENKEAAEYQARLKERYTATLHQITAQKCATIEPHNL